MTTMEKINTLQETLDNCRKALDEIKNEIKPKLITTDVDLDRCFTMEIDKNLKNAFARIGKNQWIGAIYDTETKEFFATLYDDCPHIQSNEKGYLYVNENGATEHKPHDEQDWMNFEDDDWCQKHRIKALPPQLAKTFIYAVEHGKQIHSMEDISGIYNFDDGNGYFYIDTDGKYYLIEEIMSLGTKERTRSDKVVITYVREYWDDEIHDWTTYEELVGFYYGASTFLDKNLGCLMDNDLDTIRYYINCWKESKPTRYEIYEPNGDVHCFDTEDDQTKMYDKYLEIYRRINESDNYTEEEKNDLSIMGYVYLTSRNKNLDGYIHKASNYAQN